METVMKEYADLSREEKTLIVNFFAAFDPAFHRSIKQCLRNFIEKKGSFCMKIRDAYFHQNLLSSMITSWEKAEFCLSLNIRFVKRMKRNY